jgi:hypothetical protein
MAIAVLAIWGGLAEISARVDTAGGEKTRADTGNRPIKQARRYLE